RDESNNVGDLQTGSFPPGRTSREQRGALPYRRPRESARMNFALQPSVQGELDQDLTLRCLIHDLNNVFQTLMEAADLLSDDPHWVPVSAAILRSIERGKEITASLESSGSPPAPLETVVENAMALMRDSMIRGRGPAVQFTCEMEPGLVLPRAWAWERV